MDDRTSNGLANKRFIGIARADVKRLRFIKGRQIDHKIVEKLVTVFQLEGCRRHNPKNFVPVLITPPILDRALKASKLTQADLKNPQDGSFCLLKTPKNQKLLCLHGRHRIKAAESFFPKEDQWWTISIYLAESSGM
jgi:hypothetical protein